MRQLFGVALPQIALDFGSGSVYAEMHVGNSWFILRSVNQFRAKVRRELHPVVERGAQE